MLQVGEQDARKSQIALMTLKSLKKKILEIKPD